MVRFLLTGQIHAHSAIFFAYYSLLYTSKLASSRTSTPGTVNYCAAKFEVVLAVNSYSPILGKLFLPADSCRYSPY